MINLPHDFELRMQDMLKEAYPAFLHSYEEDKFQALRVNTLKGTVEEFLQKAPFPNLSSVLWEKRGFYYGNDSQPGKHPLHEAGVFYIQEPSAMAPAVYLEATPGEKILDLCAAPGGKSTQIACDMQNKGLLVCNEIHPARAKILSENIERMGIQNALVTNETPQHLSEIFGGYFDKILVDAPCSGEGMFRKNEEACNEWSMENVRHCANRQMEILDCADLMLRPGGRLVYSTCTFAPQENEGSVASFMERHPDYKLVEVQKYDGMSEGVPRWADYGTWNVCKEELRHTIRMFPHFIKGEGHYLAVLQKEGEVLFTENNFQKGETIKDIKDFFQFQKETLTDALTCDESRFLRFGDHLYLMPEEMPSISGLKVLRPGLHLGTFKKNRFEPSHALALALCQKEVQHCMELESEADARAYLNGMTFTHAGEKGWYLLTYMGYSIGWGKLTEQRAALQVMKNHYPKGKRLYT